MKTCLFRTYYVIVFRLRLIDLVMASATYKQEIVFNFRIEQRICGIISQILCNSSNSWNVTLQSVSSHTLNALLHRSHNVPDAGLDVILYI